MALTITELDSYVHKQIVPKTTDIIFKNSPVFTRLKASQMQVYDGGLQIQRPLIVGELNGDAYDRGEEFNIDFVTTDSALVDNMKMYAVNITLYGFDAMRNDGPNSVFSQVQMKFLNASLKMAKLLATNMYLSAQDLGRTKHIEGLKAHYDDGTNYPTIGGITRSDIQAVGTVGGLNAYTSALTSFNLPAVNVAYGNAWFGADHPDLLACTQNGWNLFWNAMQPNQRYMDEKSDLGVAGFQSFRFNAAEVVVDKYAPTGPGFIFGINSKYIEWYFSNNPLFQFGFTGFKGVNKSIDVCGQYIVGNQIMCPNPRSGFKLSGSMF